MLVVLFGGAAYVLRIGAVQDASISGGPASATASSADDRSSLGEEIGRRRPGLKAIEEALAQERRALEAEKDTLAQLRHRIENRRRQFRGGMPSGIAARDQSDVAEYNHRLTVQRTRIAGYTARVAEHRKAIQVFIDLLHKYNTSR